MTISFLYAANFPNAMNAVLKFWIDNPTFSWEKL